MPYYSIYNFQDSSNNYKELATELDDTILGPEEFTNLASAYVLKRVAQFKVKDADLMQIANAEYQEAFLSLKQRFPDLTSYAQTTYYDVSATGNSWKNPQVVIVDNNN